MPLTDTTVRNAKPGAKPVKLGLFLIVTAAGGKWWRFRYSFEGKEKLLPFGTYPDAASERPIDSTGELARDLLEVRDADNFLKLLDKGPLLCRASQYQTR
ncbi:MAG: DUF4102 domain-containing protein [Candidatus Accumulibacter sp.]|uniref:Arm DNA-binding domain-containing protein n=1 Tax=Candidatus Accumulibacter phosphatis TaxID=327160 RepID=UPI0009D77D28|nr:Arm DNA-binding domain-containing protein [Accumulibacter sp.]MBN8498093.1 DUF4102 domain-containing protein [Accumulibacter sp.]MBO3715101.1 DUF4102 domain-containing protein [Accumulibacter sp.]